MVAVSSLVAMTLFAGNAAAEDENKWSITVRGGMLNNSQIWDSQGLVAGLELQWHASEQGRVGGYVAAHRFWRGVDDNTYYEGVQFNGVRAGVRGEWHFRPLALLDPWVGAGAGVFHNEERLRPYIGRDEKIGGMGVDVSVDGGLDVHLGKHLLVGALVTVAIPLSNGDSAGGVQTSAYGEWLTPLLRLGASF